MKTISKEEISQAATSWDGMENGIAAFTEGAEWAIQQLQQPPQSVEVMTLEECDTNKCLKCGGRTAIISGYFSYSPDREPYLNGVEEKCSNGDGEEWIHGYICDECSNVQDLFIDDEHKSTLDTFKAKSDQLEKDIKSIKEFLYGEIIERREYSASRSFEVVLEYIEALQSETK